MLSYESEVVGSDTLSDGLYKIHLDKSNECSFTVEKKREIKTSYLLWHKRLGHISYKRIKDLKKKELFLN